MYIFFQKRPQEAFLVRVEDSRSGVNAELKKLLLKKIEEQKGPEGNKFQDLPTWFQDIHFKEVASEKEDV